jgi:urease accessory protein
VCSSDLVDAGQVHDEASTRRWLVDQLHLSLARADLAVLPPAMSAWQSLDAERLQQLNDWVRQTRESQEFRRQTEQMGRSMLEWLRSLDPAGAVSDPALTLLATLRPAPTWPLAWALAVQRGKAPPTPEEALLAHAFAWAENLVQAAIKAVPLGQSAGQRILAALVDELAAAVAHALAHADDPLRQAHSPMLAILSARHEAQYSRLFRS